MIEAPKEENYHEEEIKVNRLTENLKIEQPKITKTETVYELLRKIGCEHEIFEKINDLEDIDVKELKKNINTLLEFKFSQLELNKIVTQNIKILYTLNSLLEQKIKQFLYIIHEKNVVKEIIFNNPYILTKNIDVQEIVNLLYKYDIDLSDQQFIYEQNSLVFNLNINQIERSLQKIFKINNNKNIKNILIDEPILVGIEDELIIKNILNGEI